MVDHRHREIEALPEETWAATLSFKEQGHALCARMGQATGPFGWYGVFQGFWMETEELRDERRHWWGDKALDTGLIVLPTPEDIAALA